MSAGTPAPAEQPRPRRQRAPHRRRAGRVLALQTFYACDQKRFQELDLISVEEAREEVDEVGRRFADDLVAGCLQERTAVDRTVDERLQNWTLARMAVLDRCILRLGCYELLYCADTPAKVVINEYIELAKVFGSDEKTPKLVNGVLDRIARDHRS